MGINGEHIGRDKSLWGRSKCEIRTYAVKGIAGKGERWRKERGRQWLAFILWLIAKRQQQRAFAGQAGKSGLLNGKGQSGRQASQPQRSSLLCWLRTVGHWLQAENAPRQRSRGGCSLALSNEQTERHNGRRIYWPTGKRLEGKGG